MIPLIYELTVCLPYRERNDLPSVGIKCIHFRHVYSPIHCQSWMVVHLFFYVCSYELRTAAIDDRLRSPFCQISFRQVRLSADCRKRSGLRTAGIDNVNSSVKRATYASPGHEPEGHHRLAPEDPARTEATCVVKHTIYELRTPSINNDTTGTDVGALNVSLSWAHGDCQHPRLKDVRLAGRNHPKYSGRHRTTACANPSAPLFWTFKLSQLRLMCGSSAKVSFSPHRLWHHTWTMLSMRYLVWPHRTQASLMTDKRSGFAGRWFCKHDDEAHGGP